MRQGQQLIADAYKVLVKIKSLSCHVVVGIEYLFRADKIAYRRLRYLNEKVIHLLRYGEGGDFGKSRKNASRCWMAEYDIAKRYSLFMNFAKNEYHFKSTLAYKLRRLLDVCCKR